MMRGFRSVVYPIVLGSSHVKESVKTLELPEPFLMWVKSFVPSLLRKRGIVAGGKFMKKAARILIPLIFATFLCGCQSTSGSDSSVPAPPLSQPSLSTPDSYQPQELESIYQLNKPLIENSALFKIDLLDLPSEINGKKTAPSNILSKTQLLVLLYEEYTLPVVKEVGVYDLDSGEYRFSFAVNEGKEISIEWATDDLVLYKELSSSSNEVALHCCRLNTGEDLLVYQFSQGYQDASASHNKVVVYDEKIYFDDIVTRDHELVGVNLLEYNLETQKLTLYKENAQNPLLLDSGLAYLTKDEDTKTYFVEFSFREGKIPLEYGISGLAPARDELYSINNKSNDPKTRRTIWSLDSLMVEEELLLSSNVIDQPAANQYLVTWRNFTPERPIVYLRESDCFAVLLEDEIAYNTYLLGEEWGILICSHDDAPTTYYKFSYPS